jgi:hypothetical protein
VFWGFTEPEHKLCSSCGRNGETDGIYGSAEFGGSVVVKFKLGCGLRSQEWPWQSETAGKRYNHSQSTLVLKFGANDRAWALTIPSGMDDRSFGAMSLPTACHALKAGKRLAQYMPSEWQGD